MKKLLCIGFLLLISACQSATTTPALNPAPSTATPTPPVIASVTPAPSLTPTVSFTPPPTALPRFFTEDFNGSLPNWSILQSSGADIPQTSLENGFLVFHLPTAYNWVYAILGSETYADVRLDALTESRGASPESIGVVCRYSEQNGWYEFNISQDGTYNVLFGQWLAEGVAQYKPIASDSTPYLKTNGEQNEIGLACQDQYLYLYLNGKLFRKLDVTRFGLTEGKVGLTVSSFESPGVIGVFDWLKVSEPAQ